MNLRVVAAVALVMACLYGGCRGAPSSTATHPSDTPAPTPATTPTSLTPTATADTEVIAPPTMGEGAEECDSFTTALDRFVFVRLQPVVEEAADLLHSAPEGAEPIQVAAGLQKANQQLLRLVDELDLMGVPPREIVDLLLSIREGVVLYAAGFDKGARGWASGDAKLIGEAKSEVLKASTVLTEFFGWQLCPET